LTCSVPQKGSQHCS